MTNGTPPATGEAIVELAARHIGETYKLGVLVPKNDANWRGPWDGAEFCSWLIYQASSQIYGCAPNSHDPATADAYSGCWRDDAKAKGQIITVEQARRTPGAFILRVPTSVGHVVVSDGQGGTIEPMGAAFGVRRGPVSGRVWDFGILVPGITYSGAAAQPGQSEDPAPSESVVMFGRNEAAAPDPRVEALQRALAAAGFDPGPFDGQFGAITEDAVFEFQAAKNLTVDGVVGPQAGRALKLRYWKPADAVPDFAKPAQPQPVPLPLSADWPEETRSVDSSIDFNAIRNEYVALWNAMEVRPDKLANVVAMAARIANGRQRYEALAAAFPNLLPWYVVGMLHAMECNCDFKTHLHNGDPLSARTVNFPKNRPPVWDPSWRWEVSANDAISIDRLDKVQGWTLPRILSTFERYDGLGSRRRFGKATAYLWGYSNHFVRGKYVGDGQWDPEAVSTQPGTAVLLGQLIRVGAISPPAQ